MSPRLRTSLATLSLLAASCGAGSSGAPPHPPTPPAASAAPPVTAAPRDPLGPAPAVVLAPPFQPPAPSVHTTANGLTVWLLERHALPVVAVTVVVPTGSSSDPKGEAGLADQAVQMMCEGAGGRDAPALARAVDDLGAKLEAGVSLDASHVHLGVVKRGFGAAMQLLGDVIVRPRWEAAEWKRQHELWLNELKERASDPEAVARDVAAATLFGSDHPYGHPVAGLLATAPRVQLAEARRFWAQAWRPDRATVVVVGDVTKGEVEEQIEAAFGAWRAPTTPPAPLVTPPPSRPSPSRGGDGVEATPQSGKGSVVLIDHPDAAQTVVYVIRSGVAASDPRYPPLYRANVALGGTLTSRLDGDLREARGWAYAAASHVLAARGAGFVSAGGTFVTERTADALEALMADLDDFARGGLSEEEAAKTRMQARSELIGEYETVDRTSVALAHDAALGLGPDYEARSSVLGDQADRAQLSELAATFFGRAGAAIVVVGPRAKLEGPLQRAGFGRLEYRDAEGALVKGAR